MTTPCVGLQCPRCGRIRIDGGWHSPPGARAGTAVVCAGYCPDCLRVEMQKAFSRARAEGPLTPGRLVGSLGLVRAFAGK